MISFGRFFSFPDAWGQDPPDEDVFLDDERFDGAEWPEDFEAALDALSRAALAPAPPSRKQRPSAVPRKGPSDGR